MSSTMEMSTMKPSKALKPSLCAQPHVSTRGCACVLACVCDDSVLDVSAHSKGQQLEHHLNEEANGEDEIDKLQPVPVWATRGQ